MPKQKKVVKEEEQEQEVEEKPKSMSALNRPVVQSNESVTRELSEIRQKMKFFEKNFQEFDERINQFNSVRVNEIFRAIDIWNSDVSFQLNKSNEFSNILRQFGESETKMMANKTRDELIRMMQGMFIEIRNHLADVNSVMKDKVRHADEVKRKIMTLFS